MVDEAHDAIAATLGDPEVRVMVLASAVERYFSAGADLNVFKGMKADGMRAWATRCHDIVRLLRGSPKPLLAAINGPAVGGGLEMALHSTCALPPPTPSSASQVRIGFIPPIATTQALARLIGRPRAIRYLYEGGLIAAGQARGVWSTSSSSRPACVRGCRATPRSWRQSRRPHSPPSGAP